MTLVKVLLLKFINQGAVLIYSSFILNFMENTFNINVYKEFVKNSPRYTQEEIEVILKSINDFVKSKITTHEKPIKRKTTH